MPVVLIVDDDEYIRDLWAEALSEEGFEVRAAPSGVQGVEIAKAERIDVIVTDILMPDKDGIETLLEIKSACPHTRILVVSGGGLLLSSSYVRVAEKLGADASLQKPVDLERFCNVVAELAGPRPVPDSR
ncbi:MAG: response regulator [Alphaproteobacteria bacterium]